ncbi:MAG: LysM peptidoglycan-binding domain-containing protein [Acidimicrobiales bacterium]
MIDLDERLERAAADLRAVVERSAVAAQPLRRSSGKLVAAVSFATLLVAALALVWVWRDAPADDPVSTAPPTTAVGTTVPGSTPPTTAAADPSGWPPPGSVLRTEVDYVIREGDYPATVASMWQVDFEELMALNGWTLQPDGIVPEWPGVGATILIPAGATVPDLTAAPSVSVAEQQTQVTLTSELTCDRPFREPADGFDSFVLELFSDRDGRRWLMRATFPDGSTYELVATGSVIYPETLRERGTWKGAAVGCGVGEIVGAPIGQSSITALNIVPELTADEVPFFVGDVAPDAVESAGERTTATGFRGTAFEQVINAFTDGADGTDGSAIAQTTTWIVADGTVLERTYENRIDGLGVATVTMSMIGFGDTSIPESVFDTTGWTELTPLARPDDLPLVPVPEVTEPVAACGTYTVSTGDTPAAVAAALATTVDDLAAVNAATPGYEAWLPGTVIQVPC